MAPEPSGPPRTAARSASAGWPPAFRPTKDSGKVRLGRMAPEPSGDKDSGKVRLGGMAPSLPATKDNGKVRLGGMAPSL